MRVAGGAGCATAAGAGAAVSALAGATAAGVSIVKVIESYAATVRLSTFQLSAGDEEGAVTRPSGMDL